MKNSEIYLVLGGARSGKSRYAETIAHRYENVAYIATAEAIDDEMRERIENHRKSRPSSWQTIETDDDLSKATENVWDIADIFIIDCLTVFVARRMEKIADDAAIIEDIVEIIKEARKRDKSLIFVSNEVGLGIVPDYPVGRRYRDLLGIVNQRVAANADHVNMLIAGIPLNVKDYNKGM